MSKIDASASANGDQPANFGSGNPGVSTCIANSPPDCGRRASSSGSRFWRAVVTYSVRRSEPPNAHIVGHIAGTRYSARRSPCGDSRTILPPR